MRQMSTYHVANERDWLPLPQIWHAVNPKQATPTSVDNATNVTTRVRQNTDKILGTL